MSDSFDRGPPEGGERTVNPGRDGFTIKSRLPEPLTEEEMSKIKLGTSAIYFFGAITYRDAFSRNRKTLFRFQHGGSRVFGTEDMTLSPKGNRATLNRKRKKPRGGRRGFFQNVHVERDVMARGEAITGIGLSLSHCCGAVILSHDQTRRTQGLSASRARDARATLPGHYRLIALATRYRFAAERTIATAS